MTAPKDEDSGDIWLLGRVDDVMNVSGHRLSTTEIESALVSHEAVAEAAVVGAADETTGQAVVAFVILREDAAEALGTQDSDQIVEVLRSHVAKSARSRSRARSSSWPSCRRHARARSCAACCATSPRTVRSATRPRSPTPACSRLLKIESADPDRRGPR